MARSWLLPGGRGVIFEDGDEEYLVPGVGVINEDQAAAPVGGRIMSSMAAAGGLAGSGGIAGKGGGLAG